MKSLHNIEKSAFRHGEYAGWNKYGALYRIVRTDGGWWAIRRYMGGEPGLQSITARTLEELSVKLAKPIRG